MFYLKLSGNEHLISSLRSSEEKGQTECFCGVSSRCEEGMEETELV